MSEAGGTLRLPISVDEPYFAGHFPADPVVPGVVILEHVIDAISSRAGVARRPRRIDAVKFVSPLRPGEELSIELENIDTATVRFICRARARTVATGTITLNAAKFEPQHQ